MVLFPHIFLYIRKNPKQNRKPTHTTVLKLFTHLENTEKILIKVPYVTEQLI